MKLTPDDIVILEKIFTLLEKDTGSLTLLYATDPEEWQIHFEWGKEAEDSDMAGASIDDIGMSLSGLLLSARRFLK